MIIELVIIKLLQRQQLLSRVAKEEKFFLFGQLKFEKFHQILISFLPPFLVSFIILSLFNEPLSSVYLLLQFYSSVSVGRCAQSISLEAFMCLL